MIAGITGHTKVTLQEKYHGSTCYVRPHTYCPIILPHQTENCQLVKSHQLTRTTYAKFNPLSRFTILIAAERLIFGLRRSEHITDVLASLHYR